MPALDRHLTLQQILQALRRLEPELSPPEQETLRALGERLPRLAEARFQEREALELSLRELAYVHHVLGTPYDFRKDFAHNGAPSGPPPPDGGPVPIEARLLGFEVGYPLGVPASALTAKASWIDYFSRYGFNVFTYKTVRREAREELPYPNWIYLRNLDRPLPVGADLAQVVAEGNSETYLSRLDSYSTANSFGVPSTDPAEWQQEVRRIVELLPAGKLLIVSVMGTEDHTGQEFLDDFTGVALLAAEAGAPAIELNVSCPNKLGADGEMMDPLCQDPQATRDVVRAVRGTLNEAGYERVPLVAKLGYLDYERLSELVPLLADDLRGIAGINTLQVPTLDPDTGQPVFQGRDASGQLRTRVEAGLAGVALRYLALDFVQSLNRLRKANNWDFDILAMGGVMDAHDVRALRAAGADCVQTATAASTNPELPLQMREWGLMADDQLAEIRRAVLAEDGSLRSPGEVAELLDLPPARLEALFPGSYDLPRFVAEIVACGGGIPAAATEGLAQADPAARRANAGAINTALKRARRRLLRDQLLTVGEAAERIGIEEDEVRERVANQEMVGFGLETAMRIPAWQFAPDDPAAVIDGVPELAGAFPGAFAALSAFVVTPHPGLEGRTPLEALQTGHKELVLSLSGAIAAAGR